MEDQGQHQGACLAEPYDLLELLKDLWYDRVASFIVSETEGCASGFRILTNFNMLGQVSYPAGTRALCLDFSADFMMPEFDGSSTRVRVPYLLIDGYPCIYMAIGRGNDFDDVFRVVCQFKDAV